MNHARLLYASAFLGCAALLLGSGCAAATGAGSAELRQADDTPSAFVTEDGTAAVQECRSAMVDPRDQTRVRLVRSAQLGTLYRGDYQVTGGKYGVREGELLRLDCETGQVIGIIRS